MPMILRQGLLEGRAVALAGARAPETVDALKTGLMGDSYGKGSTAEQAEASALMEAIERYSGIFQGN